MPYLYGFDWTYIIIVLPFVLLSMWTSTSVNSTFKRYSKVRSISQITGAQAARRVLHINGVRGVRIEQVSGSLRLSESVYGSNSVAAIGVACHEAGHAVQYAKNYAPIKLRAAIIPVTNIGSKLAMPLIILGVLLSFGETISYTFVYLGITCFSLSLIFQLVTLPVEFNASRRAMQAIESAGLLTVEEQRGVKKTLSAAAMTYVAATAVAFAQLLRLIVLYGGRGRRNRN